ncbi:MAG: metallophosphoesterase family protein [Carboxydocellales bacterium]
MKIAIISDLHSNLEALRSVLQDIDGQNVQQIYCTGDLVGYAPFPNEVIDLIRGKRIPTVLGNYDDGVGNMRFICGCDYKDEQAQVLGEQSINWTKEHTTEQNKEFLRNLPLEIRFNIGSKRVLLVHGSPNRLNEYLFEQEVVEKIAEMTEQANTDILVCGHTHIPYHVMLQNKHVINAGSVGKPKHGGPQATYVILSNFADVKVEIRKVEYNFEATALAIEESDLPNDFAKLIRLGTG